MWLKRLIVYSAVIAIIVPVTLYWGEKKQQVSPLGNLLSAYFYHKISAADDRSDLQWQQHVANVPDKKLNKLYQKLDWSQSNLQVEYSSPGDAAWLQRNFEDAVLKPNYLKFWQTARPGIREFYNSNIEKMDVNDPVVHFRCSDVPFIKYKCYHLSKVTSVQWIAEQIKSRGYKKIILLGCNKHRKVIKNSCGKYLDFYSKILTNAGLQVERQCHSVYHDFALMVNAPLLVSLNTSSYSFMAGIAKDPKDYISCNMGVELNGQYYPQTEADWVVDPNEPLLHSGVTDYHDFKDVISKLAK